MNVTKEELKNAKIGDTIEFGEIEWKVLDKGEDTVLIMMEKPLFRKYHSSDQVITWEKCSLRKWLNNDFFGIFSDDEKEMIAETKLENKGNKKFGTDGGKDTVDRIFILSIDDVKKYKQYLNGDCRLRSPGENRKTTAAFDRVIDHQGRENFLNIHTLPVMNLKI